MFDLEVGKVGELQNRRVFNIQSLDVKLIFSLEQQILVKIIVERTSAKAVLEVVDQHHLDGAQIEPIKFICLDL